MPSRKTARCTTSCWSCAARARIGGPVGRAASALRWPGRTCDLAWRLIAQGVDRVYLVDDPKLAIPDQALRARPVPHDREAQAADCDVRGDGLGRDLAPRVASEMRAGMTADCTDLQISDVTDPRTKEVHEQLLLQIRPAFGGNIIATIVNYDRWPQMATVREGVMAMLPPDACRTGEIIEEKVEFDETLLAVKLIERHIEGAR